MSPVFSQYRRTSGVNTTGPKDPHNPSGRCPAGPLRRSQRSVSMENLLALEIDDDLHDRTIEEGMGIEYEGDPFCWLADQAHEIGN